MRVVLSNQMCDCGFNFAHKPWYLPVKVKFSAINISLLLLYQYDNTCSTWFCINLCERYTHVRVNIILYIFSNSILAALGEL